MSFDRTRLPDPQTYFVERGLVLIGRGRWRTTSCPFHGGSDSMRVNTESGGWCCMACPARGGDVLAFEMAHTGVDFVAAARRLGAWTEEGENGQRPRRRPLPFNPRDALEVLADGAYLVAVAAGNVARGVMLTKADRALLRRTAARIHRICREVSR